MRKILTILAAAALLVCAFGCNNSNDTSAPVKGVSNTVATVDGISISKAEYQTYLNENFGDKALMALAESKIVEAWAKEEGVTPTKEQIDKEIQKLKDEAQYEEAIEQLGEKGVKDLINEQLLRTNLSKKLTPPTDEEIKQGYEAFKSEYVHGPRKQVFIIIGQDKATLEEMSKQLETIVEPDAFKKKVKELSEKYEGDKKPNSGSVWVGDDSEGVPEEIAKAVKNMEVNAMSKPSEIKGNGGPNIYYMLKVVKAEDKVEKKLEEVKDEVIDKVALMNSMQKPDFREGLQKRTENAKITINIEKYKDLADLITQPAPSFDMPAEAPAPAKEPAAKPEKK